MNLEKFLRLIFIISSISFTFCSCKTNLKIFYEGWLGEDVYVVLDHCDSTFFYCKSWHKAIIDYKELGKFRTSHGNLLLAPLFQYASFNSVLNCKLYDCKQALYMTYKDSVFSDDCINDRIYRRGFRKIQDVSMKHYFPDDSTAFCFYNETYPLRRQKLTNHLNSNALPSELIEIYEQKDKISLTTDLLFLNKTDSSYIHKHSDLTNKELIYEIGDFRTTPDSLFLSPKCRTDNDTLWNYENYKVLDVHYNVRSYKKKDDKILNDNVLEEDNPFASCKEMAAVKIKQSRRERSVLYSRKVLDRIY